MYFGEKGITATHAAFIKNICKEVIQQDQNLLDNTSFIDSSISLIGESTKTVLTNGTKSLDAIKDSIICINKVYSLAAWLGEAIKEKEKALDAINNMQIYFYSKEKNISLPKIPMSAELIKDDDIIKQMSIEEKVEYLNYETQAAQIGKLVHPNGVLSEARKKAMEAKENPVIATGLGRDTTIKNRSLSIPLDEIDKLFFDLQNEQRKAQGELNKIKSEIKKKVDARNLEINDKYKEDYALYEKERHTIELDFKSYVIKERQSIAAWKIIIPEKLKDIYELLDSLGK